MKKLLAAFLSLALLVGTAFAQEESEEELQAPPSKATANAVSGLELPPDLQVNRDEGFISLQAKTKGEVKWLVVAPVKVKYVTVPQTNSIIISVPATGGNVSVFAVALVEGKLTEFARTNITVDSPAPPSPTPPTPTPNPTPPPQPQPIASKLHLTFLVDLNNTTPDLAQLLNSESLRKGINQRGHWFRLYDIKNSLVTQKKLDQVVAKVGTNTVLVIQTDDGKVVYAQTIPRSEQEIFNIINQITGGGQ